MRTKALEEAEAAHLEKLKAMEEASRLEAEKVAAEAARKAEEEAQKNVEAQTLAAKAKTELDDALMAARDKVLKDADIPMKFIGTDDKGGPAPAYPWNVGLQVSLEKPPANSSSMFLEKTQFINEQMLRRLEREAAEQKKLADANPRCPKKPPAGGEPSHLSKGVTEQGHPSPAGEFLPQAASTAAARLSVEVALRCGPNNEEFGRVLADNERLWTRVDIMSKGIKDMSRDIKFILERQSLPPPISKPAAATTSTMTGIERCDSEQVFLSTQKCLQK